MSNTAIPKSLNLASLKPTTIPAMSRRVESMATNAQTFTENGIANIVLDTSTPGSFLDPMQSMLQFDVTITNTNPYIDYINLSASGMAAIIQDLRIICQGTPIEEMYDYNLMFEMFMDLGGTMQEEFKMYMENSWRAPVLPGQSDLNFVKPPMVDREGVIMCPTPLNQFGDPNLFTSHFEDGNQLLDANDVNQQNAANTAKFLVQPFDNFEINRCLGPNYLPVGLKNEQTGNLAAQYGYIEGSNRCPGNSTYSVPLATNYSDAPATANIGTKDYNVGNYIHLWEPGSNKWTGSTAPGNIRSQTWTNRIDNTYVTWPSTIRPDLDRDNRRKENDSNSRNYRVQDYMAFLANVKNIPVGIAPQKSFVNSADSLEKSYTAVPVTGAAGGAVQTGGETLLSNWNFTELSAHMSGAGVSTSVTYSITLPIFSGIIGQWAEKQFPTMLISPGSFYLQIKFAKASQAFQCSMDPCRRVFGTYRDYVPNAGLPNFYATEFRGQNLAYDRMRYLQATTGPASANNGTAAANTSSYMALTTVGTLGWDFAWQGILGLYPPIIARDITANTGLEDYSGGNGNKGNGLRNNIMYNCTQKDLMVGGAANEYSVVWDTAPATDVAGIITGTSKISKAGGNFGCANFIGQGGGYTTGNPKPQYVPRSKPFLFGGNGFSTNAINASTAGWTYTLERNVCYGTYLPCSTAQVRRHHSTSNSTCSSDPLTNLSAVPTYVVSNLRYVGIQTILPDEVTASIVRTAANSDISLYAQSVRSFRTVCSNSLNQNLILPVKVASANSMWIVFQNQKVIENTHYASLTRTCPFTSFQWNNSKCGFFVGSETAPTYKPLSTKNGIFNIQLKIGNDLLPVQPMTCLQHVMTELQRSIHGMGDMHTVLPFYNTIRGPKSKEINSVPTDTNASEFLCIRNNDFTVPHIPIEALDDQTITNNPIFMDYLASQANITQLKTSGTHMFRGNGTGDANATALKTGYFNDRGTYVFPQFIPPVSKFLLGFDLDTFPGTNDTARSGKYLGNAPLLLSMTNTEQCNTSAIANSGENNTIIATAMVLHDIRFSIMAGGQVLAYY